MRTKHKIKRFLKRIMCEHEWEELPYMSLNSTDFRPSYLCRKCGTFKNPE